MRTILLIICLGYYSGLIGQEQVWKSGIEIGTGLSFTGFNANLAYTGQWNKNQIYLGPKIVYSDANALFDAPWGGQIGYRRFFKINDKLNAFASLEYQWILFSFAGLNANDLNSIQEVHFSYGFQYFLTKNWSIGNSIGGGGYIERLVDPFDGRVDRFSGYSSHIRIFVSYQFL